MSEVNENGYDAYEDEDRSKSALLSFIVESDTISTVGKAYTFIYKEKRYYVPISLCTIDKDKNIIRIPDWIVEKNKIGL